MTQMVHEVGQQRSMWITKYVDNTVDGVDNSCSIGERQVDDDGEGVSR